jgi:hypothetical protein
MGLFQPEDINEMDGAFTSIIKDNNDGFVVEFAISVLAAKELVELYLEALQGNAKAQEKCWHEYAKMIAELTQALNEHEN